MSTLSAVAALGDRVQQGRHPYIARCPGLNRREETNVAFAA